VHLLPPPLLFRRGGLVVFPYFERRLAAEPAKVLEPVGVQPATVDGGPNRWTRSASVVWPMWIWLIFCAVMDPQDDAQLVRQAARRMALTRSFVFIVYRSRHSAQNAIGCSKIMLVQKDKRKECQPGHGPLRLRRKELYRPTAEGRRSNPRSVSAKLR
jgi:hypothetical protein